MNPSNSPLKLSPDRETASCIQNKNGKRSFFRISDTDVTDNDIYHKRKKSIIHSQVEINNAVLTAQNGYMTRNKLKKQLTNNSELVETIVIEDKCSRTDNIKNKSETANKNRKPSKKIHKKMLQLGFVFTNDISSPYPGKNLDTEYKKSTPSLFESDSDPEIDYFQIKNSIKNEVKEISTCISYPDDICLAFDKNVEMRTYFNKKSYPINNKSNIISLNTSEEINKKPSSLYDHIKTFRDSNLYNNISQDYCKTNKSLEVTADSASMSNSPTKNKLINIEPYEKNCVKFNKNEITVSVSMSNSATKNKSNSIEPSISTEPCKENGVNFNKNEIIDNVSTSNSKLVNLEPCDQSYMHFNKNEISPTTSECVQTNTEDDEIIVVTESFIRQLKTEFEITKTESQGEIRTQELFYDNNINKSNDSDIGQNKENKVVSKILSSDFEVNQMNLCTIDTNIDDICDVNFKSSIYSNSLLKQGMDVIDDSHNIPSPSLFTTTNNVENSLMSIFDEPRENILVENYANTNNSLIIDSKSNSSTTISEEIIDLSSLHTFEFDNSNSDQLVENYPNPEKNITCHLSPDLIEPNQYFHTIIKDEIKIKMESFYIKENYNCPLKNDSLNSTNDSFSKKYKSC